MSLLINQGKQVADESAIIEENDVLLIVYDLYLLDKVPGAIKVEFKINSGKHEGKIVSDLIFFDPSHSMSWKYRKLRKAAGVPYKEDEPEIVDIQELLLKKAVVADLSSYHSDKKNADYQNFEYKEYKPENFDRPNAEGSGAWKEEESGEPLPF